MKLYIYITSKYFNELLLKMWKELSIFRLYNKFFSITNDFDSSAVE